MSKSKGYTLIELMIIVAIIAIVGSVVLSAIKGTPNTRTGSQSYTATEVAQRLVCVKDGEVVTDEPALPGERWSFENGSYITIDSRGNMLVRQPNGDCEIR